MYSNTQIRYNYFYPTNVGIPIRIQSGCVNPFIQQGVPGGMSGVRYYTIG
jgi:hypothetical protein